MDLKVAQLAGQLRGFDNFAEREQLQRPARPYGGKNQRGCGQLFQFIAERRRRTVWPRTHRDSGTPVLLIY
jgi:hypothetical protein